MRPKVDGRTPCVRMIGLVFAFLAATLAVASAFAGNPEQPAPRVAEADDSETPVYIPDYSLLSAVLRALGKEWGYTGDVTRGEMASLGELAVTHVRELTGIEHAVNLYELSVNKPDDEGGGSSKGPLSDLAPLAGLTSLETLHLYDNQISDVSPLAGLTSLRELDLRLNPISDVSPLAGLTSLETLYLSDNYYNDIYYAISDVSPLAGLTSLETLHLYGYQISDVSPLAGLTSLRELDLRWNPISDVSPLAGLTSLETLHLTRCDISDVSPLAGLTSLETLDLYDNRISDVSPLAGLTSLETLDLWDNRISDVSPAGGPHVAGDFASLRQPNLGRVAAVWHDIAEALGRQTQPNLGRVAGGPHVAGDFVSPRQPNLAPVAVWPDVAEGGVASLRRY